MKLNSFISFWIFWWEGHRIYWDIRYFNEYYIKPKVLSKAQIIIVLKHDETIILFPIPISLKYVELAHLQEKLLTIYSVREFYSIKWSYNLIYATWYQWVSSVGSNALLTMTSLNTGCLLTNPAAQSPQWYAWGPPNMQCRLCASCWIYWKKYGGLKTPTQLEGAGRTGSVCLALHILFYYSDISIIIVKSRTKINHVLFMKATVFPSHQEAGPRGHMTRQEVQGMSPFTRNEGRAKLLAKNRQTFILQTTKLTRIARRVCEDILQPHRAARRPYASINANAVKAECMYTTKTRLRRSYWNY